MAESDISQNIANEHHEDHHTGTVPAETADDAEIHGSETVSEDAQHGHHQEGH